MSEDIQTPTPETGDGRIEDDTSSIFLLICVSTSGREGDTALGYCMIQYTPKAQSDMRALLRTHRSALVGARVVHMEGATRICPAWTGYVSMKHAYNAVWHLGDEAERYAGAWEDSSGSLGFLDDFTMLCNAEKGIYPTFILRGKEACEILRHTPRDDAGEDIALVTPSTLHLRGDHHEAESTQDPDTVGEPTYRYQRRFTFDALGARLDIRQCSTTRPGGQGPTSYTERASYVVGCDHPAYLSDVLTRPKIFQEIASPTDPAVSEVKRTVLHAADTGDHVREYIDPRECVAFESMYGTMQEVYSDGTRGPVEQAVVSHCEVYPDLLGTDEADITYRNIQEEVLSQDD